MIRAKGLAPGARGKTTKCAVTEADPVILNIPVILNGTKWSEGTRFLTALQCHLERSREILILGGNELIDRARDFRVTTDER